MTSERSQRARIAALSRSAREPSGTAMTEKARQVKLEKIYAEAGIDPDLPDRERERQEAAARKAHMTRLSRKAAAARSKVERAMDEAIEAEAEIIAASGDAV